MTMGSLFLAALLGQAASPAQAPTAAETGGRLEVVAELVEIPSKFPPDDLYDYAFVMRYRVTTGSLKGQSVLVAHYKPRQKRSDIRDAMKPHVGGRLKRFKKGDRHKLVLAQPLRKIWPGALVDDFFATDRTSPRYWCLQVDPIE